MRHTLVKTTIVVAALVGATVVGVSTHAPTAAAANGPAWPIETYGTPSDKDNVVIRWDEQLLSAIRAYPGPTGPTITARALAEMHTAMYDAWAAYDQAAVPATPNAPLLEPTGPNTAATRDEAMSYAAYRVLADLFPWEPAGSIFQDKDLPDGRKYRTPDELLVAQGFSPSNTTQDPGTAAGIGNVAAAATIAYCHQDGSNQLGGYANTTTYRTDPTKTYNTWNNVVDKWSWQPMCVMSAAAAARATPPSPFPSECTGDFAQQKPLTPQWSTIRTFGPEDPATGYPPLFAPPGPNADGTHTQATADIDKELADSSNLSDTQKMKAEYWADGPNSEFPPGHMAVFAQAFSRMLGDTADQDVKLFFALGQALLDASVFAWTTKYQYDSERPTTGIRERYRGKMITSWLGPKKGYGKVLGQYWLPYQPLNVVTPGFPEYVSGHSTFSAAGRLVINQFFGTDNFNAKVIIPAGSSRIEPGVTPAKTLTFNWKTLSDMADDAGMSRRYGGIHFESGDQQGRALGRLAGYNVWVKAQGYFAGTPTG
jgi:hypothetical protein